MADPRKAVDFEGIDATVMTFKIDNSTITYSASEENGSAQVGLAVTLSTDDTIALVGDGEVVVGKLLAVFHDNYASVQVEGGMTLPGGSGATLTIGAPIIGDLGAASAKGYIQSAAAIGSSFAQSEVQNARLARGMILNNDTTTAVKVFLS